MRVLVLLLLLGEQYEIDVEWMLKLLHHICTCICYSQYGYVAQSHAEIIMIVITAIIVPIILLVKNAQT